MFPRPDHDTGVGVHDDANCYWKAADMHNYARMLREHGITWYLLFVGDENKADYCRALVDAGIMPIVRFWPAKMPRPNIDQGHVDAYLAAGAQWFVLGNEFNLNEEWTTERPQDGPEKCADWYARVASEIRGKGGWPLTPPPSLGGHVNHRIWFTRFLQRLVALGFDLEPGGVGLHCRSCGNPLEDGPEDYDCSAREWEWFDTTIRLLTGKTVPMANLEAFDEPNWYKRLNPELTPLQKWDWWRERNLEQMRWFDPNNEGYRYPPHLFANCFWLIHDGGTWNDCGLLDNFYYYKETGRGRETDLWKAMPSVITWERGEQPPPPPPPPYKLVDRLQQAPHGFEDLRVQIEAISDMNTLQAEQRTFGDIGMQVLHHSASDTPTTPLAIAKYHIESRGYPTIAYHFCIDQAGKLYFTAKLIWSTYHAIDRHKDAVGICLFGDFTNKVPTQPAIETARWLVMALCEFVGQGWGEFRLLPIMPHFMIVNNSTACPGKAWRHLLWGDDQYPAVWPDLRK